MNEDYKGIRPISTGDIGHHPRTKHKSALTEPLDPSIRPRASKPQLFKPVPNGAVERRAKRSTAQSRKQKSQRITDLWDSLQHFSTSNLGRSLHDEGETNVHFVNLCNPTDEPNPNPNPQPAPSFMRTREPMQTKSGRIQMITSTAFSIPELPSGRKLMFNILSTWGDPHYLGLMGIEVFDRMGHLVKISNPDLQVWADPADINVLPEYDSDPRTVDNLLDGVNHTCDDLHAWLAPFTSGQDHIVCIEFDFPTSISMIRIWNYNKSRIHSFRGARYIEVSLDGSPIFKGEVRKASGSMSSRGYEQCSECILFTTSETILGLVEKYDASYGVEAEVEVGGIGMGMG
ncbi:hypothetical protein B484DRAFT_421954, partial [Ochromonadaceae sp. CCMP2298]